MFLLSTLSVGHRLQPKRKYRKRKQKEKSSQRHRCTGNFLPGVGGGKTFAQKIVASCPNFYETVEKKRGPYECNNVGRTGI